MYLIKEKTKKEAKAKEFGKYNSIEEAKKEIKKIKQIFEDNYDSIELEIVRY